MKKLSLFLIISVSSFSLQAQQGTYADVEKNSIRIGQLDSAYKNVLDPDPGGTLFKGKGSLYYDAHEKLLADLAAFLKQKGFAWGSVVKAMARIYYKASGQIDHFICDVKKAGVAEEKALQFDKLLREFMSSYNLSIVATHNYYHRSPVTFKD